MEAFQEVWGQVAVYSDEATELLEVRSPEMFMEPAEQTSAGMNALENGVTGAVAADLSVA